MTNCIEKWPVYKGHISFSNLYVIPHHFPGCVLKAVLLVLNISNTTVQNSTDFTKNRYFSDNWWHLKCSKIHFFQLKDVKKNNLKIQIVSLLSNFAYSRSLCSIVWCVYLCMGLIIPASQQACSARGQYALALTLYALLECVIPPSYKDHFYCFL